MSLHERRIARYSQGLPAHAEGSSKIHGGFHVSVFSRGCHKFPTKYPSGDIIPLFAINFYPCFPALLGPKSIRLNCSSIKALNRTYWYCRFVFPNQSVIENTSPPVNIENIDVSGEVSSPRPSMKDPISRTSEKGGGRKIKPSCPSACSRKNGRNFLSSSCKVS